MLGPFIPVPRQVLCIGLQQENDLASRILNLQTRARGDYFGDACQWQLGKVDGESEKKCGVLDDETMQMDIHK